MQTEHFQKFMESYAAFLEELAGAEGEKYAAMVSYDARRVDKVVTTQQAANRQLEQLEKQREEEQAAAGFAGMTFHEILAAVPAEEREGLQAVLTRFEKALLQVKYFNARSTSFAKEGLQMLGLAGQKPVAPYTADGKNHTEGSIPSASLFETQI